MLDLLTTSLCVVGVTVSILWFMKNSSFCISLLVFILLMCSCKTKNVGCEVDFTTKENVKTNYTKYQALVDTFNVLKIEIDKSKLTITEHITITKYDKDTGAVTEKTETERKIAQDSDKVSTEGETKGQSAVKNDSLNHIADVSKKIESETKEESIGGQEAFGKWFGITIGCVIGLLIVYLLRKFRVN
mgnify:CR=1 FL=1